MINNNKFIEYLLENGFEQSPKFESYYFNQTANINIIMSKNDNGSVHVTYLPNSTELKREYYFKNYVEAKENIELYLRFLTKRKITNK